MMQPTHPAISKAAASVIPDRVDAEPVPDGWRTLRQIEDERLQAEAEMFIELVQDPFRCNARMVKREGAKI